MKAKFKVGDIVKGVTPVGRIYNITTDEMHKAKVVNVDLFDPSIITIEILDHVYNGNIGDKHKVCAEYFELVEEKQKPIVIYRKDNQVIALDQSTGKKSIAKCCPTDEFDFNTGAKIAFARLMGEEVKVESAAPETKANPEIQDFLELLKDMINITEKLDHLGILK